jgi:hypothetical protein
MTSYVPFVSHEMLYAATETYDATTGTECDKM